MGVLTSRSTHVSISNTELTVKSDRVSDLLVWVGYTTLLSFVISRHEPWFDEAQAWLLARDATFTQLITHYLRYEGTPGLWHYLLLLPAKAGLPYRTMSLIAGFIASFGVLLFLLAAPFPKWIRYLFPFSFFIFYQYAVVARSYVLLPILLFGIASIYRRTDSNLRTLKILTLLVALLANVSLHGLVLANVLTAAFAIQTFLNWDKLPVTEHALRLTGLGVVMASTLVIIAQLSSPGDLVDFGVLNFNVRHLLAVSVLKVRDAFTGYLLTSALLIIASSWWFLRRGTLLLFIAGVASLLVLDGLVYSNVWHEGPLVLWWVFVMWMSWPEASVRIPTAVNACWLVLLAVHLSWSARTTWFDARFPYSGSEGLAHYIQARKLDEQTIFAFGPKCTAVLPYFPQNIFANWPHTDSFWRWSTSNSVDSRFTDMAQVRPNFVILAVTRDSDPEIVFRRQFVRDQGYQLLRRFDGALYWKAWVLEGNFYELYQRVE